MGDIFVPDPLFLFCFNPKQVDVPRASKDLVIGTKCRQNTIRIESFSLPVTGRIEALSELAFLGSTLRSCMRSPLRFVLLISIPTKSKNAMVVAGVSSTFLVLDMFPFGVEILQAKFYW